MTDTVSINEMTIALTMQLRSRSLDVTMLISKAAGSDPIREDTVALIIETTSDRLLLATKWPTPGYLPEVTTRSTTANAEFGFQWPSGARLKRAIVVVGGTF